MIERRHTRLLLTPRDLQPSRDDLKVIGTFNPGAAASGNGDEVVLLVRVAEQPTPTRPDQTPIPRWNGQDIEFMWINNCDCNMDDPRTAIRNDGRGFLRFISHLRVVRLADGVSNPRIDEATLRPGTRYETYGVEDPRITPLGDGFAITYVAVSRHGISTCLATTDDFRRFDRKGIIFCPENKDVTLFPEKVGGRFVALHRPSMSFSTCPPEMWLAYSPDGLHWGQHRQLVGADMPWAGQRVGGGCPPLLTDRGWLVIYHGAAPSDDRTAGVYHGAAMLLDRDDPSRIIGHATEPIMTPSADFEQQGFLPRVVFPTGAVLRGDRLLVYYGAADDKVAVTEFSLQELLDTLKLV